MAHIADAIEVNERTNSGDNEEECASERVDVNSHAEGQVS